MYIFESLREEHENIRRFTDDLEKKVIDFMENNVIVYDEFYKAIDFIRNYADKQHHQKEENILFTAMSEYLDDIARTIINNGMLVEHNLARGYVWELERAVQSYEKAPCIKEKLQIIANAMAYVNLLRKHIDKENNVLYPYGEKNLSGEIIEVLDKKAKDYDEQFA